MSENSGDGSYDFSCLQFIDYLECKDLVKTVGIDSAKIWVLKVS
ncbi:hypothetical protein Bb109J_c2485 [Bdellovibrio bacteriovorus]|nr:hypothetical protein Bb109J_c2485 [Bdellovibrio bacteriovorus]